MKNYVQRGHAIYEPAPTTVPGSAAGAGNGCLSGDLVCFPISGGGMVGVAGADTPAGVVGAFHLVGIFVLPKVAGAMAVGQLVYTDPGQAKVTTATGASSGFVKTGMVTKAALSGDTTVEVRLNGAW